MTINYQRLQILESLGTLDSNQSQKVLEYIKGLSVRKSDEATYSRFKREAMKEIRSALTKDHLRSSF
ncbi:MAG: hypothetical protein ABIS36_02010 [Chryseolinea sp.]